MDYHAATFRLLGSEPPVSSAAEVAVAAAENGLGITFPRSVRQWYVRQGALEILAQHSNDDPPIPIQNFTMIEWQSRRLLPFRNENQGVCTWAICLDGSDDPPVYVDVDSGGREWNLLAATFSSYVYSCVWDYRMVFHQPGLVQAQNGVLSDAALEALGAAFTREILTHGWPGSTQYRFVGDGAAILIWASEGQADWFVGSATAAGLELALRELWNLDEVGASLYECSEIGKNVLEKLRQTT